MKRNICIFLLAYLMQINKVHSQTQTIDSLKHLLQTEKQDSTRCLVLAQLGFQYQGLKPDIALIFAQQGLLLAGRINYLKGEVKCLGRIGSIYSITGNGTKGLELVLQSLKMSEHLNDQETTGNILLLIGGVYSHLGDLRKSLEYTLRSKDIASAMHLDFQLTVSLIDIGDSYEKLDQLDSAKFFTEEGYELAVKKNYPDLIGVALNNLGNIYSKKLEQHIAMDYYRRSIPYQELSNEENGICETTLGMARLFLQQGQDDSCLYYAGISYASTKKNGFTGYLLKASNFLADFYKQKHNVDSAYLYLSAVIEAKDSMFSQEKIRAIQNLGFEESMRQQEIASEKKKAEEDHVRNLQLLAIGVFIPMFFIGVLLLSRTKVKPRVVEFLGILSLLLFFEFVTDLIYPYVSQLTNENPIWEMLFLVSLAALLEPLNFKLEHWVKGHLIHKPVPIPTPLIVEDGSYDVE
jgi:tetratricopeptide (TPR) repeat protein